MGARRRLLLDAPISLIGMATLLYAVAFAPASEGALAQPAAPRLQPPQADQTAPKLPQSDKPLSQQLDQSHGVIKPPPTGDAEINVPPKDPNVGGSMPVIPPPGSPGGRQDIQPK